MTPFLGFLQLWSEFLSLSTQRLKKASGNNLDIILWTSKLTQSGNIEKYVPKDEYIIEIWSNASVRSSITMLGKRPHFTSFLPPRTPTIHRLRPWPMAATEWSSPMLTPCTWTAGLGRGWGRETTGVPLIKVSKEMHRTEVAVSRQWAQRACLLQDGSSYTRMISTRYWRNTASMSQTTSKPGSWAERLICGRSK